MLGDLLCAVPALRALRAGCPQAEITLIGLPWADELAQRLSCIDRFIPFPGYPGLPETPFDAAALPPFLARMQAESFDLLLQLHGSGTIVNPLVAAFGAAEVAGFAGPGAWCPQPGRFIGWPQDGREIERLLALTDHLGLPRQGTALEFAVTQADRAALATTWPQWPDAHPYVCVHAGAQWPSRRWLPERFAAVADAIAARGRRVVLTGSAGETALVGQVRAHMRRPATDLAGRTSLWTLGALIEGAELVLCNDTGISHIAAALGRPSVVVSSGSDVARWAPLDESRHTVLWQAMDCRPCSHASCPAALAHACAQAIDAPRVAQAVDARLLHRAPGDRAHA